MSDSESELDYSIRNPDVVTKYKTAADIAQKALAAVRAACVAGAKVVDICKLGDKTIEEAAAGVYRKAKDGERIEKGIAFPTCISVNNTVCHFSPLESDPVIELAAGDVVKIELGAHIDGLPALVGETLVIGASKDAPATGRKADAIQAAYLASEAALRLVKPGGKSSEVIAAVNSIVSAFDCKVLEGFASHQVDRNVLDGEKTIVFNPSEAQRKDVREIEFEENEVYCIDILVSTGDGKARQSEARTTVYRKTDMNYMLKLKTSRAVYSEVQAKAGSMAFTLRSFEDEKKARMGIVECAKHGLVTPFDVYFEKEQEVVAVFKFTVLLMPSGQLRITTPEFAADTLKSEKALQDEELLKLIATPIVRKSKAKKKKAAKKDDASAANDEADE